jgi:hypothetical protein
MLISFEGVTSKVSFSATHQITFVGEAITALIVNIFLGKW